VHRAKVRDHFSERVAELLVDGFHVCPERVAADFRHDLTSQDRVFRRILPKGGVAVPHVRGQDRVVLVIVEHEDFGEFALRPHRMDFELAEHPAHLDVLLRGQMLIADHDHLVLDQGGLESRKCLRIHGLLEIKAMDFSPQLRAQALDLEQRRTDVDPGLFSGNVDVHVEPPCRHRRSTDTEV
jgi:hypothetical protein